LEFGRRQEASALASHAQSIFVTDDPHAASPSLSRPSSPMRLSLF